MPVVIVAILQSLVYLASVPVFAAFSLSVRDGLRFGAGASVFERRFALRRAEAKTMPEKKRRKSGPRLVVRAAKRLRGMDIRLRGRVCLGDAAATATACGALRALAAALGARARRVEVDVAPLFGEDGLRVDLEGMIRLRAGQIMSAIAVSGINDILRRIALWKDTRLKA